ncbi:hypothetical protein ACWIG3_34950 [Streptomyces celluloflavus]
MQRLDGGMQGLVLADQSGQVEADLDGHEGSPGEVEGHIVGNPAPQLAVECEVEGGDHAHSELRLRASQKGDVHVGP